jgi:hypothetical protein
MQERESVSVYVRERECVYMYGERSCVRECDREFERERERLIQGRKK